MFSSKILSSNDHDVLLSLLQHIGVSSDSSNKKLKRTQWSQEIINYTFKK